MRGIANPLILLLSTRRVVCILDERKAPSATIFNWLRQIHSREDVRRTHVRFLAARRRRYRTNDMEAALTASIIPAPAAQSLRSDDMTMS